MGDRERAFGYLEGARRVILVEPDVKLTETPKLPGLDGQKMSKSYGNMILMREEPKALTEKVRRMTTDPARVRRTDPGEPERCPVWQLHKIYSTDETRAWAAHGCRYGGHRLPRLQAASDRRDAQGAAALARAGPALPRRSLAAAVDRGRRVRSCPCHRAGNDARSARRDGPRLRLT